LIGQKEGSNFLNIHLKEIITDTIIYRTTQDAWTFPTRQEIVPDDSDSIVGVSLFVFKLSLWPTLNFILMSGMLTDLPTGMN
jgi:hypothetical protein